MSRQQHSAAPAVSNRAAWWIVIASCLMAMTIGLTVGALGPSLPPLHAHLHVRLSELGILIGINFFGSLASTLALGPLLDRYPPRLLLIGGSVVAATGLLLLPAANTMTAAIVALALVGLGGGSNTVASTVLTTRLFTGNDGRALSWINMSFGVGAFAGPLIAAASIEHLHDYRPVFVWIAVAILAPTVIFAVVPLPGARPHGNEPRSSLRRFEWRAIGFLAAVSFVYLGAEVGFGGWVFTYVHHISGADIQTASYAPAGFWLALGAGSMIAALRPRALRGDHLVLACAALAAVASVGMLLTSNAGIAIVLATCYGLFLGPIYPLNLASAAGIVPRAAGLVTSLVICSSQLGGGALPWLQGYLIGWSVRLGAALTLVLCLLMAAIQLLYLRSPRAESASG